MKNSNYVLDCRASVEPTKDPGKCYAEWLGCKKVPGPVLLALQAKMLVLKMVLLCVACYRQCQNSVNCVNRKKVNPSPCQEDWLCNICHCLQYSISYSFLSQLPWQRHVLFAEEEIFYDLNEYFNHILSLNLDEVCFLMNTCMSVLIDNH